MIITSHGGSSAATAADWLSGHGFEVQDPSVDGRIHRARHNCSPNGSEAGWYWLEGDHAPYGACGCWRCGLRENLASAGSADLTDEQRQAARERSSAREAETEALQREVSARLTNLRKELEFAPADHPYLVSKAIKPCGALIHEGNLILMLVDVTGRIWSAEGISATPRHEWGGRTKSFEAGGRIQGCFFPIGAVTDAEKVLVCEGFATGATIHEATGLPVACAMAAGNLKAVAAALRTNNPAAIVILCADNDRHRPDNPGVTKAEEAALSLTCEIAVPDFKDVPPGSNASDYNDLARVRGLDAVRESIAAVLPRDRPPVIYDAGRPTWWTKDARGEFIIAGDAGARRRLKANGFRSSQNRDEIISPLDGELTRLVHENSVVYAGPVAGWPVGVNPMGGRRVLVTSTATPLPRGPGDGSTIVELFERMLGRDQCRRFFLWIYCARRRLLTRKWHPLPALALVGPKACGKSFAQHLITLLLGGRAAKPAQYLQGVTPFNGDLFGAEHLTFEDESARCDGPSRRHLGEQIKAMLFCRQVQCHAKHRQGITLEPIWALSISLNDETEHLMVFPNMDDSLEDKILLLACEHHPRPVPPGEEETEWLRGVVERELPAFADMIDRCDPDSMSKSIQNPRTIVAGWQNPVILSKIANLSPEVQLLGLIDDSIFAKPIPSTWTGTAEQLSRELRGGPFSREAEKLLSWPAACGIYLGRLEGKHPDRVERADHRTREDGRARKWIIHPTSA